MRAVIQRVSSASVKSEDGSLSQIGPGLLVLLGVAKDDSVEDCTWLAQKTVKLRVFPDHSGQMNLAVSDIGGDILVVSQFTLHASVRKGTRPSFNDAARPELAVPLYARFVTEVQTAIGRQVRTGKFGSLMQVSLVNDGPVTLVIDTKSRD
ncbi:MAG: D-aminoacyl-tRNA deacylase [Opitutaceae bacterium]|nr:D-aminoacyl-tRNA deacylase [Opitutaceae bacterium]